MRNLMILFFVLLACVANGQFVDFVCTIRSSGGDYAKLSTWDLAIESDLTLTSSKVFSVSSVANGGIADGEACTGANSGATGTFKHLLASSDKCFVLVATGTFTSGEAIRQDSDTGKTVTISDAGNQIGLAVAECYNDWPSGLEDAVDIDAAVWRVDENHYVKIYTPLSERHNGTATNSAGIYTGFAIKCVVAAPVYACIRIDQSYSLVDGLIVDGNSVGYW